VKTGDNLQKNGTSGAPCPPAAISPGAKIRNGGNAGFCAITDGSAFAGRAVKFFTIAHPGRIVINRLAVRTIRSMEFNAILFFLHNFTRASAKSCPNTKL